MRPPTRLPEPVLGIALGTSAGVLRYSTVIRRLQAAGDLAAVRTVATLYEECGNRCPVHGQLEDPIVMTSGSDVAFGCPHCSDPEVFAAWTAEGAS